MLHHQLGIATIVPGKSNRRQSRFLPQIKTIASRAHDGRPSSGGAGDCVSNTSEMLGEEDALGMASAADSKARVDKIFFAVDQ